MARYWEWSTPFKIDPKDTALIIVDMQRGFVDEGFCFYTPDANAQIPVIAEFKKFCNEKGIPVFLSAFVQDEGYHNDYYWFRNKERGLLNEDGSCKLRRGTPDGEITDALAPTGDDVYFTKYTYSCFAHTQLEDQLDIAKYQPMAYVLAPENKRKLDQDMLFQGKSRRRGWMCQSMCLTMRSSTFSTGRTASRI